MTNRAELSDVPLFSAVPLNGLSALAQRGQLRRYAAGDILMHQGEPSDDMHVILKGRVRVERSHPELLEPVVLAELEPGTTVGEMGVLDGAPRTATVTAEEETETLVLGADALAETLRDYPAVASTMLHILSRRLRSTDELIGEVLRTRKREEAS